MIPTPDITTARDASEESTSALPSAGPASAQSRRGSIRARLVASLLRVGIVAGALVLMLLAAQVFVQEIRAAQSRLDDIEGTTAPAITRALWSVDQERVDALIDEISRRTGVVRVTLEGAEGGRWQRGSPWDSAWLVRDIQLVHQGREPVDLGRLQVVVGRRFLLTRMAEQLLVIGPAMLLVLLGMCLLIFRRFRLWVTEPLEEISRAAAHLDESRLAQPLALGGRRAVAVGDEIDQLVIALNAMREGLHRGLDQRMRHEQELEQHQAQLERIIEERTQELSKRFMELVESKSFADSARSRAEELSARFADFAEVSADGFWETDAQLKLTLVSEQFAYMMGTSVTKMLGRTPAEAYRDRFPKAPDLEPYMAPLRAHEPFEGQLLQMRDADGHLRWVTNQGKPFFGGDGAFMGYRGTVTDITARIEAEQALKDSEERLRTITDSVPALISYIDADQVFRFNNHVYAEWMRRPLAEITGRRLDEIYDAETYAEIEPHLEDAFAGNRATFDIELQGRVYRATYVPHTAADGSVLGIYGLIHDITRLKRIEQELRDAATIDALTGLPNRRRFGELLRDAIERSERSGKAMALMFLDLDRFKQVNDTFGHEAGDTLLKELAARLRRSVRVTDTAARLAGDEFVVILEGLGRPEEAAKVADKILAAMKDPVKLDDQDYRMSVSIGIAMREKAERDGEALLRRADSGLYAAKAAGRGCYRFADAVPDGA